MWYLRVPQLENAQKVRDFGVFRLAWDVFITNPHPFKAYISTQKRLISCKISRWKTASRHNRVDAHEFTKTMGATKCSNKANSQCKGKWACSNLAQLKAIKREVFFFSQCTWIYNHIVEQEQMLRSNFPRQIELYSWLGFLGRGDFIVKSEKEMKFEGLKTGRTREGLGEGKEYEQNELYHILKR